MNTTSPASGNNMLPTQDTPIILLIEYKISGFGTDNDFERRWAIQDFVDEILKRNDLGVCDGGSIGGGTMEVCCYVTNFDRAKRALHKALSHTQYNDYSRIILEDAEYWKSISPTIK